MLAQLSAVAFGVSGAPFFVKGKSSQYRREAKKAIKQADCLP